MLISFCKTFFLNPPKLIAADNIPASPRTFQLTAFIRKTWPTQNKYYATTSAGQQDKSSLSSCWEGPSAPAI